MLLNVCLTFEKVSVIHLVVIPPKSKFIHSFPYILKHARFTRQQVNEAFIIAIKFVVNYILFLSKSI